MKNIIEFIKKHKIIFLSLLITLLIEIFICNYGYFRTLLKDNKNLEIEYNIYGKIIEIKNIDSRVTSINFEYQNKLTDKITYSLSYIANDNSNTVSINPKVILKNGKHYINFDTHSECQSIKIELLTQSENLLLKSITLNHPNLNINMIRIIFIFIFIIFISKIKNKSIYKEEYDKNSKFQQTTFLINLSIFLGFIIIYTFCQIPTENLLIKKENIIKEDSLLMQTEAIMNGQISLLEEPSEALKNMENPYDSTKRDSEDIYYLYDVAYYQGKYYNYFGITPIITSILPFRIITGMYTHSHIFNMIYMVIAIFALYFLYKKLINRYTKKISLCNFYLGFYTILFASNFFTLLRGMKYDIVITSGIAFLLIALNLAISIYNNKKYKIIKLVFLGISSALIVLSKPTFIIYYPLIAFFILRSMKNLKLKEKIKDWIIILIPLGIFAILQMFLNYLRFDNIFEFGARYQLTGFNMNTCMNITFGKIYAGLMEYLFKTPIVNPLKFPFIFANDDISLTTINEVCYENRLIGLISIPILYIYLFKGNIIKKNKDKELHIFLNILLITTIIAIIINTCFGGICEAYTIDFKLILSIGAIILLLKWCENNQKNKDINKIFTLLSVVTIIIMVPLSLTTELDLLTNLSNDITVFFKNTFEFWT